MGRENKEFLTTIPVQGFVLFIFYSTFQTLEGFQSQVFKEIKNSLLIKYLFKNYPHCNLPFPQSITYFYFIYLKNQ